MAKQRRGGSLGNRHSQVGLPALGWGHKEGRSLQEWQGESKSAKEMGINEGRRYEDSIGSLAEIKDLVLRRGGCAGESGLCGEGRGLCGGEREG